MGQPAFTSVLMCPLIRVTSVVSTVTRLTSEFQKGRSTIGVQIPKLLYTQYFIWYSLNPRATNYTFLLLLLRNDGLLLQTDHHSSLPTGHPCDWVGFFFFPLFLVIDFDWCYCVTAVFSISVSWRKTVCWLRTRYWGSLTLKFSSYGGTWCKSELR